MVSSVNTTRLWTMQTVTRVFQETNNSSGSDQNSLRHSILQKYGVSSSDSGQSSSLADYLTSDDNQDDYGLPSSLTQAVSSAQAQPQGNAAIDSLAFMKDLKTKISQMAKDPNTKDQADQMLKALQDGMLTVTDAESGQQVKAWDPDSKTATAQTATSTTKTDWGSFLRDHLTRENGGRYVRNASGSNIERSTGNSAYFGSLNDNYYYITWKPQAASTAAKS